MFPGCCFFQLFPTALHRHSMCRLNDARVTRYRVCKGKVDLCTRNACHGSCTHAHCRESTSFEETWERFDPTAASAPQVTHKRHHPCFSQTSFQIWDSVQIDGLMAPINLTQTLIFLRLSMKMQFDAERRVGDRNC